MTLLVQKFGGTSVDGPDRIRAVATRVVQARAEADRIVVVVSAMGHGTDQLLELAGAISADPRRRHPRELDMLLSAGERITMALLAMALREAGCEAISFTGSQAAIITDEVHTGARIEEVRADRILEELDRNRIVIVAGFQGVSRAREVTTLGRGGSDTTAVALAAALEAKRCDIFTDVDGVYSADPRRVPAARRLERVGYDEMLELANAGARVLHPRAVEIGARYHVPIRVRSTFSDEGEGTLITRKEPGMEQLAVTGIGTESGHARIIVRGLPAEMKAVATVLGRLADHGISVDMVAQADRLDGRRQLQLTVKEEVLPEAEATCRALLAELGGESIEVRSGLSRIALVGSGMHGRPGVYARAFQALLEAGIDVFALSTSSVSIALLVESDREDAAAAVLHGAFGLGEAP